MLNLPLRPLPASFPGACPMRITPNPSESPKPKSWIIMIFKGIQQFSFSFWDYTCARFGSSSLCTKPFESGLRGRTLLQPLLCFYLPLVVSEAELRSNKCWCTAGGCPVHGRVNTRQYVQSYRSFLLFFRIASFIGGNYSKIPFDWNYSILWNAERHIVPWRRSGGSCSGLVLCEAAGARWIGCDGGGWWFRLMTNIWGW